MDRLLDVTYRIQQGPSGKPKVVHFDRLKDFFGDTVHCLNIPCLNSTDLLK